MKFQVLSHAGLAVDCQGKQLVCDPWLVGSTYWRSWWNYPPVAASTVRALKPDFVYLTHIHWDHFQGPSLRKFDFDTTILVPDGHDSRMREDLHQMRFPNVVELAQRERELITHARVRVVRHRHQPTHDGWRARRQPLRQLHRVFAHSWMVVGECGQHRVGIECVEAVERPERVQSAGRTVAAARELA